MKISASLPSLGESFKLVVLVNTKILCVENKFQSYNLINLNISEHNAVLKYTITIKA